MKQSERIAALEEQVKILTQKVVGMAILERKVAEIESKLLFKDDKEPELVDTKFLMKELGVSRMTIERWRKGENPLPTHQLGGVHIRFDYQEVITWLKQNNKRVG